MARAKKISESTRKRYSGEFKAEALGLAQSVGVAQAARELGLYPSQLYGWRSKQKSRGSQSETERKQAVIPLFLMAAADRLETFSKLIRYASNRFFRTLLFACIEKPNNLGDFSKLQVGHHSSPTICGPAKPSAFFKTLLRATTPDGFS